MSATAQLITVDRPGSLDDVGTLHPASSLFFRVHVGEATVDGVAYDLATSTRGEMLVMCVGTGKTYSLGWAQVLALAILRGVSAPDAPNPQTPRHDLP